MRILYSYVTNQIRVTSSTTCGIAWCTGQWWFVLLPAFSPNPTTATDTTTVYPSIYKDTRINEQIVHRHIFTVLLADRRAGKFSVGGFGAVRSPKSLCSHVQLIFLMCIQFTCRGCVYSLIT